MTDTPKPEKRYLGDGVYASFDGFHIVLETMREAGDVHWIALEPEVFDELHRYEQDIRTFYAALSGAKPEEGFS